MSNFLKSHTLVVCFALFLVALLSFWAFEKDRCFEISSEKRINIKVNCKSIKQ